MTHTETWHFDLKVQNSKFRDLHAKHHGKAQTGITLGHTMTGVEAYREVGAEITDTYRYLPKFAYKSKESPIFYASQQIIYYIFICCFMFFWYTLIKNQ